MTSGGGTGGKAATVYIDVQGRFDEFEARVKLLESQASESGKKAGAALGNAFGVGLKIATAGAVALTGAVVALGASTFNLAQESAQNVANFRAELGATTEEAERLGGVAEQVFGNNFGGSLAEAGQAVGEVRKQLGDLSDSELQKVAEGALAIKDSFGTEVPESVSAAKTLMKEFGLTSQEALDFISKGYQQGLDRSGDFLDSINEYSTQFANGGANAEQFWNLMANGAQGGALGTDKAADAFKEFRVRIQDGSKGVATALEQVGINSEDLAKKMASGQITAVEAFDLVQKALSGVKDENLRMQAGVALIGTQYEDLGQKGAAALKLTGTSLKDMGGATDSLNAKYNNLGAFVEGMGRKLQVALLPVGKEMLSMANEAVPYLQKAFDRVGAVLPGLIRQGIDTAKQFGTTAVNVYNAVRPPIESAIVTVEKLSSFLNRNKEILIPLTAAVGAGAAAFGAYRLGVAAVTLATNIWTAAQTAASVASVALRAALTFLTGPVGLVIAAITLLVGAGVALYRNWDEVKAWAEKTWGRIKEIVAGALKSASDYLSNIDWKELGLNVVQGLINGMLAGPRLVLAAARGLGSAVIKGIKDVLNIQSPSRVMKELGEFTSEGFVQGIDSTRPNVLAAAQATAKGFMSAFSDLKLERVAGNVDLSIYTKTLEQAAAQLRSKLKTVQEGTPAYTEWLRALSAVTKELDGLKGKSSGAQASAKGLADELARNRAQIDQGEALERYVKGLRSATDAQLATALATARAGGETEKYNAIREEQRRREEAVTAAQTRASEVAQRAKQQLADNRAQIAATEAQERYEKGLRSTTDAQLASALATARAAGDTEKYNAIKSEQQRRLDATTAAHDRAADAARREADAVRDGQAAIREGREADAYLSSLRELTDAELDLEAARQEGVGHQKQYNDVLSEQARRAGETADAVAALADEEQRLANVRFSNTQAVNDSAYRQSYGVGDEGLINAISTIGGLDPATVAADVDAALADLERFNKNAADAIRHAWADELQARRDQVAEGLTLLTLQSDGNKALADGIIADADRLVKDGKWREAFSTLEQGLGSLYDRSREGQDAAQGISALVTAFNRLAAARDALKGDDRTLADWRDLVASGERDPMTDGPVAARGTRPKDVPVVASAPRVPADVSKAWDDLQLKVRALSDSAVLKAAAEGLKQLDDTQLAAAKSAAIARKDVAAFSAVLTEEERRTKEAEAAQKKWADNLDRISQSDWVASLKNLSDAELQAGLDAARAGQDTDKFNAYLAEQKRRSDEAGKNLDMLSAARQKLAEVQAGGARPFAAELAALEAMRGKPGVIASEIDELVAAYQRLQAETERKKGLEDRINQWGNYARNLIPVVTGAMQVLGGTSSKVAGEWAEDLGNMTNDLVTFGTAIAKGDYLGAAIQALTTIFSWWTRNKKAAEDAAKATKAYNEQFRFAAGTAGDNYGTRTVNQYSTGFLFWQTDHYDEQIDSMKRDVALALESGFINGITDGFNQALAKNDFSLFEKSLKTSVGKAVLDGLIDSFVNKAIIAKIIGPALDEFMQTGNRDVLKTAITRASAEAKTFYDDVLKPVYDDFGLGESQAPASETAPKTTALTSTIKIEAPTLTSTIRFDVLETLSTTVGQLATGMPTWLNQMAASGQAHLEAGGRQLAAVDRLERLLDRKEIDWGALR